MDSSQWTGFQKFNLRDELFWFGNPRLLLRLIQFVSFQNAFEMATYIWSMWEIRGPSCFTGDHTFLVIRLTFGVVSQFWCSFITFPLYVIVAQMGSKFKKTIISANVRKSLHGWRRKVRTRQDGPAFTLLTVPSSLDSMVDGGEKNFENITGSMEGCSTRFEGSQQNEMSSFDGKLQDLECSAPQDENPDESYDDEIKTSDDVKDYRILLSKGLQN
ncbi:hypothetical protein Pfo_008089 [Paulownia fortunei]|nr:hypothetical protein Pfo_008089 [Paulownia fortunei]